MIRQAVLRAFREWRAADARNASDCDAFAAHAASMGMTRDGLKEWL
jgi:hypothetical protein